MVPAPSGSRRRLNAMMRGDVEAVTLTEPYLTLAEKKGCRVDLRRVLSRHRGRIRHASTPRPTPHSTARCARRCGGSTPTSASTPRYFIDYHKAKDAEIGALAPEDINPSHIVVCDPAPIPADELKRTYDWIKSWGMLSRTENETDLINSIVQSQAHRVAAE